jgi:hypothetical protein
MTRKYFSSVTSGKNELGWADFRGTNYAQTEKWWEIITKILTNL